MMDGRIGAIRQALDGKGFITPRSCPTPPNTRRPSIQPVPRRHRQLRVLTGDKKTYQMDYANSDEGLARGRLRHRGRRRHGDGEARPAYLDIVRRVKDAFGVPTYAYQVSGEYSMLRGAADRGWLDWNKVLIETLTGFKRAGCDGILTYGAVDAGEAPEMIERPSARLILLDPQDRLFLFKVHDPRCSIPPIRSTTRSG